MHRGEKTCSKICYEREISKAQDIHRKKINNVQSYVRSMTKPSPGMPICTHSLSPIIRKRQVKVASPGSISSPTASQLIQDLDGNKNTYNSTMYQPDYYSSQSFIVCKEDECRPLASIREQSTSTISIMPMAPQSICPKRTVERRKSSLHGAFHARQLKTIQANNVSIIGRLKSVTPCYRNDKLQQDWGRHSMYLKAVSEFPKSKRPSTIRRTIQSPSDSIVTSNSSCEELVLANCKRKEKAALYTGTILRDCKEEYECYDSYFELPVIHPIRAIPTTSSKPKLNLSPAYRSLRITMPAQPDLPPFKSSRSTGCDSHVTHTHTHSQPKKYEILKVGRFVGGNYLILTAYSGDGVYNPYGIDVYAYNPAFKYSYFLSITKSMIHEMLDTLSTSGDATELGDATGTNLSMENIAQIICNNVNFSVLEPGKGEIFFFISTMGKHTVGNLLLSQLKHNSVALCIHQVVVQSASEHVYSNPTEASMQLNNLPVCYHVLARTKLASSPVGDSSSHLNSDTEEQTIEFQIDPEKSSKCSNSHLLPPSTTASFSFSNLRKLISDDSCILSIEMVLMECISHLRIKYEIVNKQVELSLELSSDKDEIGNLRATFMSQSYTKPRQHSPLLSQDLEESSGIIVTGVLWRNTYLVARVGRLSHAIHNHHDTVQGSIPLAGCDKSVRIENNNIHLFSVFSALSGKFVYLRMCHEDLVNLWINVVGESDIPIHFNFIFFEELLKHLYLDVDLIGNVVIKFSSGKSLEGNRTAAAISCDEDDNSKTRHKQFDKGHSLCSVGGEFPLNEESRTDCSIEDLLEDAYPSRKLNCIYTEMTTKGSCIIPDVSISMESDNSRSAVKQIPSSFKDYEETQPNTPNKQTISLELQSTEATKMLIDVDGLAATCIQSDSKMSFDSHNIQYCRDIANELQPYPISNEQKYIEGCWTLPSAIEHDAAVAIQKTVRKYISIKTRSYNDGPQILLKQRPQQSNVSTSLSHCGPIIPHGKIKDYNVNVFGTTDDHFSTNMGKVIPVVDSTEYSINDITMIALSDLPVMENRRGEKYQSSFYLIQTMNSKNEQDHETQSKKMYRINDIGNVELHETS